MFIQGLVGVEEERAGSKHRFQPAQLEKFLFINIQKVSSFYSPKIDIDNVDMVIITPPLL